MTTNLESLDRYKLILCILWQKIKTQAPTAKKSQIPSTKLQINLKLQYPMTKTDELAKRRKPFFLSF
jgi:hypothetical protein